MAREKREIFRLAGTTDLTRSNNARFILDEFTSSRRVATLARIPTQAEVLNAIDIYSALCGDRQGAVTEVLERMRMLFSTWTPEAVVPAEILDVVREFQAVTESLEPPTGWDAFDGYPETWGVGPPLVARHPRVKRSIHPPADDAGLSPLAADTASKKVTDVAQAFLVFLNLTAGLAAPHRWPKTSEWPSRLHLVEHADEFLSCLAMTSEQGHLKAPAERLRTLLSTWEPGSDVPLVIQQAARELLANIGFHEPPDEWEAIEIQADQPSGTSKSRR